MAGGRIINCPNCTKLVIFGQTCTCGHRSDQPASEGVMDYDLTVENYFDRQADCHRFCDVSHKPLRRGVRHDPRCAVVKGVPYNVRENIAQAAERKIGLH